MNRARYLLSNINLINIMLAGALIFLVNYMLLHFLNKGIQYSLPVIEKHEKIDSGSDKKPDQTKTLSPLDYVIIAEQNLFHPERKIPVEEKEAQPLPKPDFVLFGTMISDDISIAYMEDKKSPYSTPGRGERQVALHLGNSLSGYTVNEIYHDKVVMVKGEEKIEISVLDPTKPKTRATSSEKSSVKAASQQKQPAAVPSKTAKGSRIEDRLLRTTRDNQRMTTPDKASRGERRR